MPRTSRIVVPNYPHHIIQRGHNRQTVFATDDDYHYYLENLAKYKTIYDCKVYAFCLMTNHVHLIVDPGNDSQNLGKLMKRVAGRQTRYVNRVERRSGTLWEGRFRSSPIETNGYLLACCRYVEMNPVAAGLCADPASYPWSSCFSKVVENKFDWLDFDPFYLDLAETAEDRRGKYRIYLRETVSDKEKQVIQRAALRGQLTGGAAFVDEIERRLERRIEVRGQGRPPTSC